MISGDHAPRQVPGSQPLGVCAPVATVYGSEWEGAAGRSKNLRSGNRWGSRGLRLNFSRSTGIWHCWLACLHLFLYTSVGWYGDREYFAQPPIQHPASNPGIHFFQAICRGDYSRKLGVVAIIEELVELLFHPG